MYSILVIWITHYIHLCYIQIYIIYGYTIYHNLDIYVDDILDIFYVICYILYYISHIVDYILYVIDYAYILHNIQFFVLQIR